MKIVRYVLVPLSWLFGCVVFVRNLFYDRRIFRISHCPIPVISVGNIVAGGTGKTPFVEYLVKYFCEKGKRVAVLSRGYGRVSRGQVIVSDGTRVLVDAQEGGDEPVQIAAKFPGTIVIADERRARAAETVAARFKPDVILLDDGFQHRAMHRDLDIVMIGGPRPTFAERLLPAGHRREPYSSLRRARLLAVQDSEPPKDRARRYTDAPAVRVELVPGRIRRADTGADLDKRLAQGAGCLAFCGIGNPESFRTTLGRLGLRVGEFVSFPDHYAYREEDLERLTAAAAKASLALVITTEKDMTRIRTLKRGTSVSGTVLHYLEISTRVVEGEDVLHATLDEAVERLRK